MVSYSCHTELHYEGGAQSRRRNHLASHAKHHEAARLAALESYRILDTAAEPVFDGIVELASSICDTPIALISLVDADRQWFKARHGLQARQTERDIAFCAHAIELDDLMEVHDATLDPRFASNPLVTTEPHIRFYAGQPLVDDDGFALGTLCVIDRVPRALDVSQRSALRVLAKVVTDLFALRQKQELASQLVGQLAESEARFRQMADDAPMPIWLTDASGERSYLNRAWTEFAGCSEQTLLNEPRGARMHEEDRATVSDQIAANLAARAPYAAEYRLQDQHGDYRWLIERAAPRFGAEGEYLGHVGVCIDITDRKLYRQRLERLNAELEVRVADRAQALESALDDIRTFAYAAAHDLRGPLRRMANMASLVHETFDNATAEVTRERLGKIVAEALASHALVDALQRFARLSTEPMRERQVDLTLVVREVWNEFLAHREAVGVDFSLQPLASVRGDPELLKQVFQNLIGNALKFSANNAAPRIMVSARRQDDQAVEISVADNGAGFDMRFTDKLFQPFSRLHSQEEFEGTGAGLAFSARVIRQHGGSIRGEGAVGQGAAFHITLPLPRAA